MGFISTSYSKDDKNIKIFDDQLKTTNQLKTLIKQYNIYKKNSDLKFELYDREELKGSFQGIQSSPVRLIYNKHPNMEMAMIY